MRVVMRPRGEVSTSLTLQLSRSPWHRPLAALAHLLWSHIETWTKKNNTLRHAPSPRTREKQQEEEMRIKTKNTSLKAGEEEKFCCSPSGSQICGLTQESPVWLELTYVQMFTVYINRMKRGPRGVSYRESHQIVSAVKDTETSALKVKPAGSAWTRGSLFAHVCFWNEEMMSTKKKKRKHR